MQGERQGIYLLEREQMWGTEQAGQGVQVVVVDDGGTQGVEGVQGEGGGVWVLEGQRLRLWAVSSDAR